MKRVLSLLTAILFMMGAVVPVSAVQEEEEAPNGYLFQIKKPRGAVCLQSVDGVEAVDWERGIYTADTAEQAYAFANGQVAVIEPNQTVRLLEGPNDPCYIAGSQWDRAALQVDPAWEKGITGAGVRIGVVDSGIYAEHEDFQGAKILTGYDYMENDSIPQDDQGHGTFISGVIAAQADNGLGTAGIAPDAEIVPLKCFSNKETTLNYVLEAIYGGVDDFQCHILNMSFSIAEDSEFLKTAMTYADSKGVLLVAAVGNDGNDAVESDPLCYPAAYEEVIGVGAVDKKFSHSSFSQKNESVFVAAPGSGMRGLAHTGTDRYKTGAGTSYATPCIAAMLALTLEEFPSCGREEVMEALKASAQDLGDPGWDNQYGWGFPTIPALFAQISGTPPEVTVRQEEGRLRLDAAYSPWTDLGDAQIIAAAYNGNGEMIASAIAETGLEQRQVSLWLEEADAQKIKLFTVKSGTLAPVCPAAEAGLPE